MLRSGRHSHQDGIVLVTCLVILLILTMLALSSVQSTSLQELITRNQRDSNLAFNAAEAAIVVAEGQINALTEISYALDASPLIYDAVTLGPLDVSSADLGQQRRVFALRGTLRAPFRASTASRDMSLNISVRW